MDNFEIVQVIPGTCLAGFIVVYVYLYNLPVRAINLKYLCQRQNVTLKWVCQSKNSRLLFNMYKYNDNRLEFIPHHYQIQEYMSFHIFSTFLQWIVRPTDLSLYGQLFHPRLTADLVAVVSYFDSPKAFKIILKEATLKYRTPSELFYLYYFMEVFNGHENEYVQELLNFICQDPTTNRDVIQTCFDLSTSAQVFLNLVLHEQKICSFWLDKPNQINCVVCRRDIQKSRKIAAFWKSNCCNGISHRKCHDDYHKLIYLGNKYTFCHGCNFLLRNGLPIPPTVPQIACFKCKKIIPIPVFRQFFTSLGCCGQPIHYSCNRYLKLVYANRFGLFGHKHQYRHYTNWYQFFLNPLNSPFPFFHKLSYIEPRGLMAILQDVD